MLWESYLPKVLLDDSSGKNLRVFNNMWGVGEAARCHARTIVRMTRWRWRLPTHDVVCPAPHACKLDGQAGPGPRPWLPPPGVQGQQQRHGGRVPLSWRAPQERPCGAVGAPPRLLLDVEEGHAAHGVPPCDIQQVAQVNSTLAMEQQSYSALSPVVNVGSLGAGGGRPRCGGGASPPSSSASLSGKIVKIATNNIKHLLMATLFSSYLFWTPVQFIAIFGCGWCGLAVGLRTCARRLRQSPTRGRRWSLRRC